MIRVDIESILVSSTPVPSVIVLRERVAGSSGSVPSRALSIPTGTIEAASISRGMDGTGEERPRPICHDLMIGALKHLDAKVERVEINRIDAPVFYATVVVLDGMDEFTLDARPSDAIALAVRANAPIFVEDDVMNRAGSLGYAPEPAAEEEFERFDEFARSVSPDDF